MHWTQEADLLVSNSPGGGFFLSPFYLPTYLPYLPYLADVPIFFFFFACAVKLCGGILLVFSFFFSLSNSNSKLHFSSSSIYFKSTKFPRITRSLQKLWETVSWHLLTTVPLASIFSPPLPPPLPPPKRNPPPPHILLLLFKTKKQEVYPRPAVLILKIYLAIHKLTKNSHLSYK